MNLKQFKYLKAISENNLNISAAAQSLFTTQPGVSKQIGLLEQELGIRLFERKGKNLNKLTVVGAAILEQAERMLLLEQKIKAIAQAQLDPNVGTLNIYTTHTIARYLLPNSVAYFTNKYPKINFHLQPTLPLQAKGGLSKGHADFSIVAHDVGDDPDLVVLPAYLWTLALVVPNSHPLTKLEKPSLQQLAQYPILSYEPGSTGRKIQDDMFAAAGINATYFMTVMDADLIKRYVQLNFGIGIISTLAANDIAHTDLCCINLDHLFPPAKAWICFAKEIFLQNYMYDFIHSFASHLTKPVLEQILQSPNQENINMLLGDIKLPVY